MTGGEEHDPRTGLELWAHDARARSATYAAQAVRAAESAAAIKQQVDRTIERMAERNPQYAGRLLAIRITAAEQRAAITTYKHDHAAGRPGGQPLAEPRNEPEPAAITGLQAHPSETAVIQERARNADKLHDEVVRRIFAAGLMLQGIIELMMEPEARWRIEATAGELDEVIQIFRDVAFNMTNRPPSCEPGGGPDNPDSPSHHRAD